VRHMILARDVPRVRTEGGLHVCITAECEDSTFASRHQHIDARLRNGRSCFACSADLADNAAADGRRFNLQRVQPDDRPSLFAPWHRRWCAPSPVGGNRVEHGGVESRSRPHQVAQRLVEIVDSHKPGFGAQLRAGVLQELADRE